VLLQVLGEAVSLGVVGGLFGLAVSAAGGSLFESLLGWPIAMSARAVFVALASSVTVGVCSGLYPATRAARLDPVDALRHE
jgi:putative ABC transport system permease protein